LIWLSLPVVVEKTQNVQAHPIAEHAPTGADVVIAIVEAPAGFAQEAPAVPATNPLQVLEILAQELTPHPREIFIWQMILTRNTT
jgi:hypothetical protein